MTMPCFSDLQATCPHVQHTKPLRYNGTQLRAEYPEGITQRCLLQSPDGYGARWYISGGEVESYGPCIQSRCPIMCGATTPEPTGLVVDFDDFLGSPAQVLVEGKWLVGEIVGLYPTGSILIGVGRLNPVFVRSSDVETRVRWPLVTP